ncbi:MAG: sodium:alanine symporter family protein, partial [Oscillospiraceae bacterium]|nr:sodium:alanine symporter family protein [Oscillospiraceae bacterium]
MFAQLNDLIVKIDDFVWGVPLIVVILATGIWLTIRLNLLQIFHLPKALRFMVSNEEGGSGEVSSFGALCTAMSATIGTGNIVGVATAIFAGGPGA